MIGMGDQVAQLKQFLDSPEGQVLGKLYITDLTSAMFGGLPTALAVVVADAPGYDAESAKALVDQLLKANSGALGDVQITNLEATTVNNLPAVRATATAGSRSRLPARDGAGTVSATIRPTGGPGSTCARAISGWVPTRRASAAGASQALRMRRDSIVVTCLRLLTRDGFGAARMPRNPRAGNVVGGCIARVLGRHPAIPPRIGG